MTAATVTRPMTPARPPVARRARQLIPMPLRRGLRVLTQDVRRWNDLQRISASIRRVRPYTMVWEPALVGLGECVQTVIRDGVPGAFVECGVWRGGSSFLMADLLRKAGQTDRRVWLFDSFEGLPRPTELDGQLAHDYYAGAPGLDVWGLGRCDASLEDVQASAARLRLTLMLEFVQGWFADTLPVTKDRIGPIALLRLDGDWYESTRDCLVQLYDQVSPGGFIVLDDYYGWEGSSIAVHEFLASRRLPHQIHDDGAVWFRK